MKQNSMLQPQEIRSRSYLESQKQVLKQHICQRPKNVLTLQLNETTGRPLSRLHCLKYAAISDSLNKFFFWEILFKYPFGAEIS